MEKCRMCTARPAGIDGHESLFTERMSGSRVQFKCRECDFLWQRSFTSSGAYEWSLSSGEFVGADVPGWHAPEKRDAKR